MPGTRLDSAAAETARQRVVRDREQPGRRRRSLRPVGVRAAQRGGEHLRGQIGRELRVSGAPQHVADDRRFVTVIEDREGSRIAARGCQRLGVSQVGVSHNQALSHKNEDCDRRLAARHALRRQPLLPGQRLVGVGAQPRPAALTAATCWGRRRIPAVGPKQSPPATSRLPSPSTTSGHMDHDDCAGPACTRRHEGRRPVSASERIADVGLLSSGSRSALRAACSVTAAPSIRWVAARSGTGPDGVGMVSVQCCCRARWRAGS